MDSRSACCQADPPHIDCEQVTDCLTLSTRPSNVLVQTADGALYVPAPPIVAVSGGPAIAVTGPTLEPTVDVVLSGQPANQLAFGGDGGLWMSSAFAAGITAVADTPTLELSLTGKVVSAAVAVSADAGNLVRAGGDGALYAGSGDLDPTGLVSAGADNAVVVGADGGLYLAGRTAAAAGAGLVSPDAGATINVGAGQGITAAADTLALKTSTDRPNRVSVGGDGGLFVAAAAANTGPTALADTPTVDMNVTGGLMSAAAIVSPDAANVLAARPDGLWVPTTAASTAAQVRSAQAGNVLALGSDSKLHTPAGRAKPAAGTGMLYHDPQTLGVDIGSGLKATAWPGSVLSAKVSTDAANTMRLGADNGLVAGTVGAQARRAVMFGITVSSNSYFTVSVPSNSFTSATAGSWASGGPFWVGVPFGHQGTAGNTESIIVDEDGWYRTALSYQYQLSSGTASTFVIGMVVAPGTYAFGGPKLSSIQSGGYRTGRFSGSARLSAGNKVAVGIGAGPYTGTTMVVAFSSWIVVLEKVGP